MTTEDHSESDETVLSRRDALKGGSAVAATALLSKFNTGRAMAQESDTEPRLQLGDDWAIDDESDGSGNNDLRLTHQPTGAELRYDVSAGQWVAGDVATTSLDTEEVDIVSGDFESAVADVSEGDTILLSQTTSQTVGKQTINTSALTIYGGNLKLANNADDDLLHITADDVTLVGFKGDGNRANQTEQSGSVVHVEASGFTGRDIEANNSPRHGVHINGSTETIDDITIEHINGDNNNRDTLSLTGSNLSDVDARGIRGTKSANRGTVEIADGVTDVNVVGLYGHDQREVVAYEDHGSYANENVVIEKVRGDSVDRLVNGSGTSAGISHSDLTIRDVSGASGSWTGTSTGIVIVENVDNLKLDSVKIFNYSESDYLRLNNCTGVDLADVVLGEDGGANSSPAFRIADCDDVTVRGGEVRDVGFDGYEIVESDGDQHTNFRLVGISARDCGGNDIEFKNDVADMAVVASNGNVADNATNDTVNEAANF